MKLSNTNKSEEARDLIFTAVEYYFERFLSLSEKDASKQAEKAMSDFTAQSVEEARIVNRFEVINHLPKGEGRGIVVWEDAPFTVETQLQDDGRTIKVFLTELNQLSTNSREVEDESN